MQPSPYPPACRLDLTFSTAAMLQDLGRIEDAEWVAHYEKRDFEGDWSGVGLRALGGQTGNLRAVPGAGPLYAATQLLARSPYFQQVLQAFQCELHAVRLLRLAPGSRILPHHDEGLGEGRELRLHVPVQTDELVDFRLAGQRLALRAGECWYLDLGRTHEITNHWSCPRVHLVVDCAPSAWLDGKIRDGAVA